MTVSELIEQLSKSPPDLLVAFYDHDYGWRKVKKASICGGFHRSSCGDDELAGIQFIGLEA